MLTWPRSYVDKITGEGGCQECGRVDCSPWRVKVVPYHDVAAHRTYDEASLHSVASLSRLLAKLTSGTLLTVLGIQDTALHVKVDDGPEGWILGSRTDYVSGTATLPPYVLPGADGRDGSPEKAIAHARTFLGGGEIYAVRCLRFVNDCYWITGVRDRCPEMYNPSTGNSAHDAYLALAANKKIRPLPPWGAAPPDERPTLPPGAIVFFDVSDLNKRYGHVAIIDHDGLVISSGAGKTAIEQQVKRMSLSDVIAWTGAPCLGYTTAELAFNAGRWGGGRCTAEAS